MYGGRLESEWRATLTCGGMEDYEVPRSDAPFSGEASINISHGCDRTTLRLLKKILQMYRFLNDVPCRGSSLSLRTTPNRTGVCRLSIPR